MLRLVDLSYDNIDKGLYDLEVSYYSLLSDKTMGDGVVFKTGTKVRMLSSPEDKQFFVETVEGDKNLFWVSEYEVKFLGNENENWDSNDVEMIKKYIFNDFL